MRLRAAVAVAAALGAGLLVLQRWVAETRVAAMVLVAVWFAVVGLAVLLGSRGRARSSALVTFGVIAVATAGVGYWTGFRDRTVDEEVVMASRAASPEERALALAPAAPRPSPGRTPAPEPEAVRLVAGRIAGADGHAATGRAAVIVEHGGARRLTITEFDADPGPQVEVYLTTDASDVDDRIELGGLKGNVGDQQYRIPPDADLGIYDTLVLWCVPFTTRIATAPLR